MDSWYCGKDVSYNFCDDPIEDPCHWEKGNYGAGTGHDSAMGNGDEMNVLMMRPYNAAELGAVTIYEDGDCMGRTGRLFASEIKGAKAMYT